MILTNSHKSMLITVLLSATVVILTFAFQIKKQNELVAETFYEVLPEDDFLEEKEDLEEILKSIDNLKTNQAFNENRSLDDFEDEDFKSTMEKLQSRNTPSDASSKSESIEKKDETSDPTEDDAFNEINEIIKKRSGNDANRLGTSSFSLVDRELLYLPTPVYLCEQGGKIVININVNAKGEVTNAVIMELLLQIMAV